MARFVRKAAMFLNSKFRILFLGRCPISVNLKFWEWFSSPAGKRDSALPMRSNFGPIPRSLPQRGARTQPGVLTPGNIQSNDRPGRALVERVGYCVYYEPRNSSPQNDVPRECRTFLYKHGFLSISDRRGTDPSEPRALSGRVV
jgi:hypothetical protein